MNRLRAMVAALAVVLLMVAAMPTVASAGVGRAAVTLPVTHLSVTKVTDASVALTWRHRVGRAYAGAVVRYLEGQEAPSTATSGLRGGRVGPRDRTLVVRGLDPATTYSFAVFARSQSGHLSRPVTRTTTTDPGLGGCARS